MDPVICSKCYEAGEPAVKTGPVGAVFALLALGAFYVLFFAPVFPAGFDRTSALAVSLGVPLVIGVVGAMVGRRQVCDRCGSTEVIPVDSPRGKALEAEAWRMKQGK